MGESIQNSTFTEDDREQFSKRLREETRILMRMFEERAFEYSDTPLLGLEVEAWLLNQDGQPEPANRKFLKDCNDPNLVEELAQFNFEMNTPPVVFQQGCFHQLKTQLEKTWETALKTARAQNLTPCLVGIHPLVSDDVLNPKCMSDGNRYKALNEQILSMRKNGEINIHITGNNDKFDKNLNHIMMEAAATSIQVHLQTNQETFKRVFNASLIASTPTVAVAANSPYFYGHELWDETRIPLFEQAVRIASFRNKKGEDVGRVTFGTGYVRKSALELFLENLDGYPPLLPILFDDPSSHLHHLNFHNGTLWRWNRPIVGGASSGTPHLRVEQRVMASGPSVVDIVANTAFSVGLTNWLASQEKVPEESMTFTDCEANFYAAAKDGLRAKVRWFGKEQSLRDLILNDLIPKAKTGLSQFCSDSSEISFYLDEVMAERVRSGQNGSQWQRDYIASRGKDFKNLSLAYSENQLSGKPVHKWTL